MTFMLQIVPQMKILLACRPVDFRKGIDSLVALCRQEFDSDPFTGAIYIFRNRRGTALKILAFDGWGYWLCLRRLSQGRLRWWPQAADTPLRQIEAQELYVLLYNGRPERADFAPVWRKLSANQAARALSSTASW
jgi:transposase